MGSCPRSTFGLDERHACNSGRTDGVRAMREMLSARVEVEQVRRLSALAASRGVSRSALLRQLVEDAVATEQEVPAA